MSCWLSLRAPTEKSMKNGERLIRWIFVFEVKKVCELFNVQSASLSGPWFQAACIIFLKLIVKWAITPRRSAVLTKLILI